MFAAILLFAVNPFGLHDFYNDKTKDGSHTLQKGQSISFRYRVYIHPGNAQEAKIAEQYKAYADSVRFKKSKSRWSFPQNGFRLAILLAGMTRTGA